MLRQNCIEYTSLLYILRIKFQTVCASNMDTAGQRVWVLSWSDKKTIGTHTHTHMLTCSHTSLHTMSFLSLSTHAQTHTHTHKQTNKTHQCTCNYTYTHTHTEPYRSLFSVKSGKDAMGTHIL